MTGTNDETKNTQTPPAGHGPVDRLVRLQDVVPVPEDNPPHLMAGPWMAGTDKPVRDGKYLRHWLGSDDKAFSFFRGGVWYASAFWDSKSDAQEIPWAGGIAAYPDGDVAGECICGSWPGGVCLRCPLRPNVK